MTVAVQTLVFIVHVPEVPEVTAWPPVPVMGAFVVPEMLTLLLVLTVVALIRPPSSNRLTSL